MKFDTKKQLKQITMCFIVTSVGIADVSHGSWNTASCSLVIIAKLFYAVF